MGKEQPQQYYDQVYTRSESYKHPYNKSHYFPMWQTIANGLDPQKPVIDIGCGVGQFGHYLWDKGFRQYMGLDFSRVAINQAKQRVKETDSFGFRKVDIMRFSFEPYNPCQVVCLETLEHIEQDLKLIERLQADLSGCPITISVPTFDDAAHARYFRSTMDVRDRFASIHDKTVTPFSKWIILTGTL